LGKVTAEDDTATLCNTLQHTAIHYNTLRHAATHCNILISANQEERQLNIYNTLHHTVTCCTAPQRNEHTATQRDMQIREKPT